MTSLALFEKIARNAKEVLSLPVRALLALPILHEETHPFESRNIHPDLPIKVKALFDDGHYSEATFEACKFLDDFVGEHAIDTKAGEARMMVAFDEAAPIIFLTQSINNREKNEQRGYKLLFTGTIIAIMQPRSYQHSLQDDPFICLDHLGLISTLLRKLNSAGYQ